VTPWETIVTARAGARFRWGQVMSQTVYRRGFGAFGPGSTIVAPLRLKNIAAIEIGRDTVVYERAWLQCEHRLRSRLVVGDRVYLGHDVHLHATSTVHIGDDCFLADGVTVSDGFHHSGAFEAVGSSGDIAVGDGVFIGVGAVVLGGVTVGPGAQIGAGAVVTRDVGVGEVVAGVPARPLRSPIGNG